MHKSSDWIPNFGWRAAVRSDRPRPPPDTPTGRVGAPPGRRAPLWSDPVGARQLRVKALRRRAPLGVPVLFLLALGPLFPVVTGRPLPLHAPALWRLDNPFCE